MKAPEKTESTHLKLFINRTYFKNKSNRKLIKEYEKKKYKYRYM